MVLDGKWLFILMRCNGVLGGRWLFILMKCNGFRWEVAGHFDEMQLFDVGGGCSF